jgi:hypothetical protein
MLLERGKIIEFDRYAVFWWMMRKKTEILYCVLRPATLLKDTTSKFYLLCKATGKEEFATLKQMAGV